MYPIAQTSRLAALALSLSLAGFCIAARGEEPAIRPPLVMHRVPGNLVKNPSFEQNWYNRKFTMDRRFLLLHTSDMGVGEQDGHIDHWRFQGIAVPESWDTAVARSGTRSIRFDRAGTGSHLIRFAGEQSWKAGGAFYASLLPMVDNLAGQVNRRPIVVGAWCRSKGVPAQAEPRVTVSVQSAMRKEVETMAPMNMSEMTASAAFSTGTHDWEYREIRIVPKEIKPPEVGGAGLEVNPDQDGGKDLEAGGDITAEKTYPEYEGVPWWVTVTVLASGGTVWFDDVSCVELPDPRQPNRMENGGFEKVDDQGWPEGWSRPASWGWFRNTYYAFTGWSHWNRTEIRGGATADSAMAFTGQRSFRLQVFPGDNFAVGSAPMELRQQTASPIELRAMVKADRLRTLEIMAQDQSGGWLPQGDFLGDDMEEPGHYNFGTTGSGTYDWTCVRKYFSPRGPVQTLRVFLCARGFDGAMVEKNVVGHVWLDEVEVIEHRGTPPKGSRPVPPAPASKPAQDPPRVVDMDLGDRLWGRNTFRALLEFERPDMAEAVRQATVRVTVKSPGGQTAVASPVSTEIVQHPVPGKVKGYAMARATYRVEALCASWKEQYELAVQIAVPGLALPLMGESRFAFGTPSRMVSPGASACYLYPDETLVVYGNLNIARDSFLDIDHVDLAVLAGSREARRIRLNDLTEALRPQRAPDYLDTYHLIQVKVGSDGLTLHPWSEPVLDNAGVFQICVKSESGPKMLVESDAVRFGFMHPVPKPDLPETIHTTAVNARGYITVNGRPYFPVYWTPHFGIRPEVNYPPMQFGYKSLDLTRVVCGDGPGGKEKRPDDDQVKAELLARINEVKEDPKFFQYELGDGEMQLQSGWQERLKWCKQAIPWIREADPNHLINGPGSWLVGHPGHNNAMKQFVPDWDVIGVEASFEQQPKVRDSVGPLMKERKTAVLVGLETYYYQSNETLRWRGYRSLLNGASGIGLCPSGMLQARPDKENFLRGLNGEFRGLSPIITSEEPADRVTVTSQAVETMDRVYEGKRYVIAVSDSGAGPEMVSFKWPGGERYGQVRVLFEGRTAARQDDGFTDDFSRARTVHVYELTR